MKLADTLIALNNNSDVIMTSLIIKKRNWNQKIPLSWICHSELITWIPFYLKLVEIEVLMIQICVKKDA